MNVTTLNNGFRIRNDEIYLGVGIMASLFSAFGIYLLVIMFPFAKEDGTANDIAGFVVICVWTAFVPTMCISCFITHFKEFLIDDSGISCSLFGKKSITSWSEINDWGISYLGSKRSFGQYSDVYCLYFAKSKQRTKNSNSKKFSGKVIKIYVSGDDFYRALNSVIPFCRKRTSAAPFITEKR